MKQQVTSALSEAPGDPLLRPNVDYDIIALSVSSNTALGLPSTTTRKC